MKSRPILFSAPMVRAIIEGRKTQTRRICKPQPYSVGDEISTRQHQTLMIRKHGEDAWSPVPCPYGVPGDKLWVKETWTAVPWSHVDDDQAVKVIYKADDPGSNVFDESRGDRWKSSLHLARKHSRLTLRVLSVRVERLQDISEADVTAEGLEHMEACTIPGWESGPRWCPHTPEVDKSGWMVRAADAYAMLWDHINGDGAWDANPWVWVVEFEKVVKP